MRNVPSLASWRCPFGEVRSHRDAVAQHDRQGNPSHNCSLRAAPALRSSTAAAQQIRRVTLDSAGPRVPKTLGIHSSPRRQGLSLLLVTLLISCHRSARQCSHSTSHFHLHSRCSCSQSPLRPPPPNSGPLHVFGQPCDCICRMTLVMRP